MQQDAPETASTVVASPRDEPTQVAIAQPTSLPEADQTPPMFDHKRTSCRTLSMKGPVSVSRRVPVSTSTACAAPPAAGDCALVIDRCRGARLPNNEGRQGLKANSPIPDRRRPRLSTNPSSNGRAGSHSRANPPCGRGSIHTGNNHGLAPNRGRDPSHVHDHAHLYFDKIDGRSIAQQGISRWHR